jgi:hypothetical protein
MTFERFLIGYCILLAALSPHMVGAEDLLNDTIQTIEINDAILFP